MNSKDSPSDSDHQLNTPPPVMGSWRNLYLLVIGNLLVMIGLFYMLTRAYS